MNNFYMHILYIQIIECLSICNYSLSLELHMINKKRNPPESIGEQSFILCLKQFSGLFFFFFGCCVCMNFLPCMNVIYYIRPNVSMDAMVLFVGVCMNTMIIRSYCGCWIFQQIRSVRPGIKQFKLSTVTSDLDRDRLDEMTIASVKRILEAESKSVYQSTLYSICLLSVHTSNNNSDYLSKLTLTTYDFG